MLSTEARKRSPMDRFTLLWKC